MKGKRTMRRVAVGGIAVTGAAVFMLLAFRYREAARKGLERAKSAALPGWRPEPEPHDEDRIEG